MNDGILYVVFNKWITNPETHETPYKIGITRGSIEDRYYGLGLKMPGKFEALFAYKLEDCPKAEQLIQGILIKYRENGEWFNITQRELELIKANCETMGGVLVTGEVIDEINEIAENESDPIDEPTSGLESKLVNSEKSIAIRGINIPLYINIDENTQDFVRRVLRIMFINKLIPDNEIKNMLDKEYSKKTFGIAFSMLQDDITKVKDNAGRNRYWKNEIFGGKYYVCSQWWKDNANIYKHKLVNWIMKIAKLNDNT